MFEKYTEIIYKGSYNNPIRITFENAYIALTGEGGNRRILIGDNGGYMNLWIDTHVFDGKYFAFLGDVGIVGEPSPLLVNRVWKVISETVEKNRGLLKWTEKRLNSMFDRLYYFAKSGFYF